MAESPPGSLATQGLATAMPACALSFIRQQSPQAAQARYLKSYSPLQSHNILEYI